MANTHNIREKPEVYSWVVGEGHIQSITARAQRFLDVYTLQIKGPNEIVFDEPEHLPIEKNIYIYPRRGHIEKATLNPLANHLLPKLAAAQPNLAAVSNGEDKLKYVVCFNPKEEGFGTPFLEKIEEFRISYFTSEKKYENLEEKVNVFLKSVGLGKKKIEGKKSEPLNITVKIKQGIIEISPIKREPKLYLDSCDIWTVMPNDDKNIILYDASPSSAIILLGKDTAYKVNYEAIEKQA